MRVLLVGNYAPDAQQSMRRFGAMLHDGLRARGTDAQLLAPAARVAPPGRPTYSGVGKWLAYVDKYGLFPPALRVTIRRFRPDVVHVCDHSNAVYVPPAMRAAGGQGRKTPVLVTCHDLGAVRGAFGEAAATFCPASPTGKILQRWIARGLARADHVACDTAATAADVCRLIAGPPPTSVIPLGFQAPYRPLPPAEADARLEAAGVDPAGGPFLLHVGSGLTRKNREGVLATFAAARRSRPDLRLVFAGEALTGETAALAAQPGVAGRVVSLVEPTDATVEALYSRALALVFPSRFEGFGWPVIEAQACGCPVVCGDTPALAEVAGEGAFVAGPDDTERFAAHLLRLAADPAERARWVERGYANAARFHTDRMLDAYVNLYRQLTVAATA